MLKNISPCVSSELLKALNDMGHGDVIVIADGNFPGCSICSRSGAVYLRADGVGVPELLDAVLSLIPLDAHCDHPVGLMRKAERDRNIPCPIWDKYREIVAKYDERGDAAFTDYERFEFYDYVEKHASVIVVTGEKAVYGNIILQKGVVRC